MADAKPFVNDLATRSFRDVADQDYIAARLCFRSALMVQFAWMAHQAIEKYLKAILIYNGQSSKGLSHNLDKSLNRIEGPGNLSLSLSPPVRKFIGYLDDQGPNRYLEKAHYTKGMELLELDRAVWQLRLYCRVIDHDIKLPSGEMKNLRGPNLKSIDNWLKSKTPHKFRLTGGHLEKVVKKRDHPQREPLIWANFYYGLRAKKKVRVASRMNAVNPTQIMHPEYFSEFDKVVHFPKEVRDYFLSQKKSKKKK